jgi:hypothetical protein
MLYIDNIQSTFKHYVCLQPHETLLNQHFKNNFIKNALLSYGI